MYPILDPLPDFAAQGILWQATRDHFLLEVPEVARYMVSGGSSIAVTPMPGAAFTEVVRFMGMMPLAALHYQSGRLVFHAAACVPPHDARKAESGSPGAILLAGDSGAGKSTLLAALVQRGWQLLADDLVSVDIDETGHPAVIPNPSPIRLWPQAREKLAWVEPAAEIQKSQNQRLPLSMIYWLQAHNQATVEEKEISGTARFAALGSLSYNSHIADAILDRATYMRKAAAIARTVPVVVIRRPRGTWCIDTLVERITDRSV